MRNRSLPEPLCPRVRVPDFSHGFKLVPALEVPHNHRKTSEEQSDLGQE